MTKRRTIDLDAVRTARANLKRIAKEHPELVGPPGKANRTRWESTLEETMSDQANDEQIVVRLPGALLARIDAYAEGQRKATGLRVSRSDAVRLLVARALDAKPSKTKR
jgi:hypothetical protein